MPLASRQGPHLEHLIMATFQFVSLFEENNSKNPIYFPIPGGQNSEAVFSFVSGRGIQDKVFNDVLGISNTLHLLIFM